MLNPGFVAGGACGKVLAEEGRSPLNEAARRWTLRGPKGLAPEPVAEINDYGGTVTREESMRTRSVLLALGVALAPLTSWAQTDGYALDDYQLRTSGDLLDICTLDPSHVNYWEARGFCLGYFAGGIDLHAALAAGQEFPHLACPGEGVTRNDVVEAFVIYAQAHPEHLQERPMDTAFRAVADRWPCA